MALFIILSGSGSGKTKLVVKTMEMNQYGQYALMWTQRLLQPEPNPASLIKLGQDLETIVQTEMLNWANGDYDETDLVYPDETEVELRRAVEIKPIQELINSLIDGLPLTEGERLLIEAESEIDRPSLPDLVDFLAPAMIESKESRTPLTDLCGTNPTELLPTEITYLADLTGISMYDLIPSS